MSPHGSRCEEFPFERERCVLARDHLARARVVCLRLGGRWGLVYAEPATERTPRSPLVRRCSREEEEAVDLVEQAVGFGRKCGRLAIRSADLNDVIARLGIRDARRASARALAVAVLLLARV